FSITSPGVFPPGISPTDGIALIGLLPSNFSGSPPLLFLLITPNIILNILIRTLIAAYFLADPAKINMLEVGVLSWVNSQFFCCQLFKTAINHVTGKGDVLSGIESNAFPWFKGYFPAISLEPEPHTGSAWVVH